MNILKGNISRYLGGDIKKVYRIIIFEEIGYWKIGVLGIIFDLKI